MVSVTEVVDDDRRRVVLIHGAATTSRIWRRLLPHLNGFDLAIPDRPCSGDLDTEIAALAPLCAGAVVVGVSGGATLGLELAARECGAAAILVHEPAVGSLAPGLLDGFAAAYAEGGVDAFASSLYGPSWRPTDAAADPDAVRRDLAMFRGFEPSAPSVGETVLTSVGGLSPQIRQQAAQGLHDRFSIEVRTLPGSAHAVHLDNPAELAELIREVAAEN
jgi:pimeloyl-ACP methyl ester carboxylesterase